MNKCNSLVASVDGDPCENPAEPGKSCHYCQEFESMCQLADEACQECGHLEEYHEAGVCTHGAYIETYLKFPCNCGYRIDR